MIQQQGSATRADTYLMDALGEPVLEGSIKLPRGGRRVAKRQAEGKGYAQQTQMGARESGLESETVARSHLSMHV